MVSFRKSKESAKMSRLIFCDTKVSAFRVGIVGNGSNTSSEVNKEVKVGAEFADRGFHSFLLAVLMRRIISVDIQLLLFTSLFGYNKDL
ncbi:hypothetical protein CDAR_372731 [Caerostris darwini]|uniref:Uncharacterized protein n=1 Tax=Caerostris darwini TaxID=1538125 RepID=A0AAV4S8X5_9ARAC|nr:hypothetical protein CDAR_372731 [Caerostris darwini]